MAASAVNLPPGFELDGTPPVASGLPPGFEIDKPTPKPEISKLESFAQGAGQGASMGFGDEGAGMLQAAVKKGKDALTGASGQGFWDAYRKARDIYRAKAHEAQDANPKTYMGGEFAGAAATAPLMGEATMGKMAALGALQGLGSSEADLTKGDVGGAVRDTAIGAGVGAVGGAVGEGVQNILNPDVMEGVAKKAGMRALGFTKRFLNSPDKLAKARNVAQTMLDEGVITPGASANDMSTHIATLIKNSGENIGNFLKSQGTGYETQSAVDAIDALRPAKANGERLVGGAYDKMNDILDKAVETIQAHGDVIPFQEANSVKSLLQDLVNWNSTKMESALGRKIAGAMRQSIDDTLEKVARNPLVMGTEEVLGTPGGKEIMGDKVFRAITPEEGQARFQGFRKDKKVYGAAQEAQDAMANRISSEQGNKAVGLTDNILGGTIAAGEIAAGHAPVGGVAAVVGKKMVERYGAQTTASTADWMAKTLRKSPQILGKYARPLLDAAQKGIQQLGIAHWVLSNTDPAYREIIRQEADKEENQ